MNLRTLGRTALQVSEVGFGAWGIGKFLWVGADDEISIRALHAARDGGINFFDTALAYGDGHSEKLIARAFGNSSDVLIASKVPPQDRIWPAHAGKPLGQAFPKKYVLKCLDQSLRNLGRDTVDVYQFHVWSDEWANQAEWLETVRAMKNSGKTRFVGISINNHQPGNALKALDSGLIDCVQVIYNIFDQSPEDELFLYCRKNRIGVIARCPFDEGSLTGNIRPDSTFPDGDFRQNYFRDDRKQQVWDHVQKICRDLAIPVAELPQVALRFCLSHPAISSVIPGMRSPERVSANVAASKLGPLPAETLAKLRSHRWQRSFYAG